MLLANVTHCQRKPKSCKRQIDIKSPQQPEPEKDAIIPKAG